MLVLFAFLLGNLSETYTFKGTFDVLLTKYISFRFKDSVLLYISEFCDFQVDHRFVQIVINIILFSFDRLIPSNKTDEY